MDWVKKTCLGVLERGDRDKDNETGLKEGGGIEMSTTVLPLRDARSLRFEILTSARQCPQSVVFQTFCFKHHS